MSGQPYPVLNKSGLRAITDTTAQYFQMPPGGFAAGAKIQIVSSSSLLGKIAITSDRTIGQDGKLPSDSSVTYTNVISVTSAGTPVAANANITCVTGEAVLIPVSGITWVRFTPSSGTGSIELVEEDDNNELIAARTLQLVASGLTATLGAGTAIFGSAGSLPATRIIRTTVTVDTSIYANNDVLFTSTAIAAARANDVNTYLVGAYLIDKADNAAFAVTLHLLNASTTIGTINGAVSISAANMGTNGQGYVVIGTSDTEDMINSKVYDAPLTQFPKLCAPATGTQNVYVAGVLRSGTPTFANATDLILVTKWQDCLS